MDFDSKFIEKIRKQHDECKEHPFWKTLSNDFHAECVDMLREMVNSIIGYYFRPDRCKHPHVLLLYPIAHNLFGCMTKAKLMPKYNNCKVTDIEGFGTYVMCLQAVLQIIHYYVDGIFDEESMVVYNPYFGFDKEKNRYTTCTYQTYGVRDNGDGTYRSVRIITEDEIPDTIKWCSTMMDGRKNTADYFAKNGMKSHADSAYKEVEYYQECIEDLNNRAGKYYIVKR